MEVTGNKILLPRDLQEVCGGFDNAQSAVPLLTKWPFPSFLERPMSNEIVPDRAAQKLNQRCARVFCSPYLIDTGAAGTVRVSVLPFLHPPGALKYLRLLGRIGLNSDLYGVAVEQNAVLYKLKIADQNQLGLDRLNDQAREFLTDSS